MARMFFTGIAFAATLGGLSFTAAAAPQICAPRATLVESLLVRYAEQPVSMGVDAHGAVIEVFSAPAGNWTILMTQPTGLSCLIASGKAWETLPVATASAEANS